MNRWYFWVLAPIALAAAIIIPMTAAPSSLAGRVVVWLMVATLLLGTIGLSNVTRFGWALRLVAAVIVLAGVWYFSAEFVAWRNGKPIGGRRSGTSLVSATLFLLVFALPAFRYMRSGHSGTMVDTIAAPAALDEESRDSAD